jgi:hypothetical protein
MTIFFIPYLSAGLNSKRRKTKIENCKFPESNKLKMTRVLILYSGTELKPKERKKERRKKKNQIKKNAKSIETRSS